MVPVLADAPRPDTAGHSGPWIINATLIPVHDQTITAPAKNYRRSINAQIIISAHTRGVVTIGHSWPGNRNDVVVARATVAHLSTGHHEILGDGGYRGINTITTPARPHRPDHPRPPSPRRRVRARVEDVIARLKDWQILRQCRRRGNAINHSLQILAGLWNLKPTSNYGSLRLRRSICAGSPCSSSCR